MQMPKLGGPEVCRLIRKSLGLLTVPIIVVSVVEDLESVLDVFKVGATDYLMKPYVKEELMARLNTHLRVRLLNRKLASQIEELRRLNKLKDRFLEVCSSNLQPPMHRVVQALDDLSKRDLRADDTMRELRKVSTTAKDVLQLLGNLLKSD
jgi:DNA-binding response OmpR family regulator